MGISPYDYAPLSLTNKKVRGAKRRIRGLERWSKYFDGWFPEGLMPEDRYCHWHIPVLENLIQGKQGKLGVQIKCAQILINTCAKLIAARPKSNSEFKVFCIIYVPNVFDSVICIQLDGEFYKDHLAETKTEEEESFQIRNSSLVKKWRLNMPEGFTEIGFHKKFSNGEGEPPYISDWWFLGEIP